MSTPKTVRVSVRIPREWYEAAKSQVDDTEEFSDVLRWCIKWGLRELLDIKRKFPEGMDDGVVYGGRLVSRKEANILEGLPKIVPMGAEPRKAVESGSLASDLPKLAGGSAEMPTAPKPKSANPREPFQGPPVSAIFEPSSPKHTEDFKHRHCWEFPVPHAHKTCCDCNQRKS